MTQNLRPIRFPNKQNALEIISKVNNKELSPQIALVYTIVGLIFAVLHIADVLEERR